MIKNMSNDIEPCNPMHEEVERYSGYSGIEVCIQAGCAHDYLFIRKEHLKAISIVLTSESFDSFDQHTQASLRYLTNALTEEVSHLIPIALKEARERAVRHQGNSLANDVPATSDD